MSPPVPVVHRARHYGLREAMEDRDVVVQREIAGRVVTFLGVYDGHGGGEVADRASAHLDESFFDALGGGADPQAAFRRAYADVAAATAASAHTGSTGFTAALIDARLTAAWVGDSQLVVATPRAVRFVSAPHRLDDAGERRRVLACGAEIDGVYLMRGEYGLMVTRAFGDGWFHPVGVNATPSVATFEATPGVPHLAVLATDGLWDVIAPPAVVQLFGAHENETFDYARALADLALGAGTRDNVTVITAEWVG